MISKFTAKFDAETKQFMRKMREVQAEAEKLQDEIVMKINANINDAVADIGKVQQLAEKLDGKNVDIQVDADTLSAVTQLERAKQAVDDLKNNMNNINIKIRANVRQFFRALNRIKAELIKVKQDANVIDIKANIQDFMRDILQVRTLAQELEQMDISIKVRMDDKILDDILKLMYELEVLEKRKMDIDIRLKDKILDDILTVMYELEALEKQKVNIKVELDLALFYTQITMVNAEIQAMQHNTVNIDLKLDTAQFGMDIAAIQALLAGLAAQSANINLNVDMSEVVAAIHEVKLAILSLRDVTVDIHADITNFLAGAAVVQQVSKKLSNKNIVIKIWVDFTNAMQAYATVVRSFQEAGQQMMGGSLMAMLPTLVPIFSTLAGLIGNIGVMLGVAVTSAFALVTALGAAAMAAGAFAAVAIPTIKTLFDENVKLTAQQKAAKQSFDDFKATYDGLVKATEQPVLNAFTSAMQAANKILQALEPMFLSVADAVAGLMESLNQSIDSQPLQDFFAFLNNDAAGLLTTIGEAVGYLLQGLFNMMTAFAPLAKQTADGFREMAKGFAEWANGLSQSDRFAALMEYVNEYMPIMKQAFKDLTIGIIEFFAAFAEQSQGFIQGFANMMSAFREWASALGENDQFQRFLTYIQESTPAVLELLKNLWNTLIGLGIAMAPVAENVMSVANSFLQWFSAALQAEGTLAKIVGILPIVLGVITALVPVVISVASVFGNISKAIIAILPHFSNLTSFVVKLIQIIGKFYTVLGQIGAFFAWFATPVGMAVAAIAALVAIFVVAYNKVDWFREMCDEAWNHIKTLAVKLFGEIAEAIRVAFENIANFTSEALTLMKKLWDKYGDEITLVIRVLATVLQGLIQGLMTLLFGIIEAGLAIIVGAFSIAWDLISGAVSVFIDLITGIVKAGMQLLQGDWEAAWNTIVTTTESIAGTIVETLSSIIDTVWQIGSDIISGLVNGISSGFDWVKQKIGELAGLIPDWLKGPLGIHSPSRVMASVSKWIPAGVAKGITDNLNVVKTAAKELAGATMPDFSKTMKLSERQIRGAQNAVSNAINNGKKEVQKITSESNKKIADIESKLVKDISAIQKTAANKKRSLTKAELSDISKLRSKASKEIKEIETKLAEDVAKQQKSLNGAKLENLTNYVNKQKELHGMSAAEEAAYWKYAATAFKAGTDDKMRALLKYTDAYNRAMQEQFDNEIRLIDEARKYGAMSRREEIVAYEEYMKQYKLGSEQQVAYERKIYDSKKALYNDLKAVAENYLTKVQDVYQKLADEEQRLRDEYQQTFESRRDTLANTWGLFDEVNLTEMVTYNDDGSINKQINLLDNMRQQVETLAGWMHNLTSLTHRAVDEGLIKELQNLGPKAAAEVNALVRMSEAELREYERLWKAKTELAGMQATKELAGAREEMENEIVKLRENASKELEQLKVDMLKEVDEMVNGSTDTFDILNATLPEIGRNAMQGLIDAFKAMSGPLKSVVNSIANDVSKSMENILMGEKYNATKINTTSSITSSATSIPKTYNSASVAQQPTPIELTVVNEYSGDSVRSYIDREKSANLRLNIKKT